MKKTAFTGRFVGFKIALIALSIFWIYSCYDKKEVKEKPPVPEVIEIVEDDEAIEETVIESPESEEMEEMLEYTEENGEEYSEDILNGHEKDLDIKISGSTIEPDDFKVILSVDEQIKMHETAELKVWIGGIDEEVTIPSDMVSDDTTIPGSIGHYAKITPYAPDFDVDPSISKCEKIHLSGSEVRFMLKPKTTGSLDVSANIELYDNKDCTGAPVPKTAATLKVVVKIDHKRGTIEKLKELGNIVWDKFLSFWGALFTFLFAVVLYLIRRYFKRRTGFNDNGGQE